jgi:riboflavin kinase/FMN adenylyltransferase
MEIHRGLEDWKAFHAVITTGIFDGVHRGHQAILGKLKEVAKHTGGISVVITFWPHPRMVLGQPLMSADADGRSQKADLRFLTTIEEKSVLLEQSGIDHLVILPFTREFASLTACEFIEEYLVRKMNVHQLVIGYNHHFGRNREGDYDTIVRCSEKHHFAIDRVEEALADGEEISSTRIRQVLEEGNVEKVSQLLGYEYFLQGTVVGGSRVGREIGFPTANISPGSPLKAIPAEGVYAVYATVGGKKYPGMLNIGRRPTIQSDQENTSIEVHMIGFEGNIYGEPVTISFVERIRDEMKFDGVESLRRQLIEDRRVVVHLLGGRG